MMARSCLPTLQHLFVSAEKLNSLIAMDDRAVRALCIRSLKHDLARETAELDSLRQLHRAQIDVCAELNALVARLSKGAAQPLPAEAVHEALAPLARQLQSTVREMNHSLC